MKDNVKIFGSTVIVLCATWCIGTATPADAAEPIVPTETVVSTEETAIMAPVATQATTSTQPTAAPAAIPMEETPAPETIATASDEAMAEQTLDAPVFQDAPSKENPTIGFESLDERTDRIELEVIDPITHENKTVTLTKGVRDGDTAWISDDPDAYPIALDDGTPTVILNRQVQEALSDATVTATAFADEKVRESEPFLAELKPTATLHLDAAAEQVNVNIGSDQLVLTKQADGAWQSSDSAYAVEGTAEQPVIALQTADYGKTIDVTAIGNGERFSAGSVVVDQPTLILAVSEDAEAVYLNNAATTLVSLLRQNNTWVSDNADYTVGGTQTDITLTPAQTLLQTLNNQWLTVVEKVFAKESVAISVQSDTQTIREAREDYIALADEFISGALGTTKPSGLHGISGDFSSTTSVNWYGEATIYRPLDQSPDNTMRSGYFAVNGFTYQNNDTMVRDGSAPTNGFFEVQHWGDLTWRFPVATKVDLKNVKIDIPIEDNWNVAQKFDIQMTNTLHGDISMINFAVAASGDTYSADGRITQESGRVKTEWIFDPNDPTRIQRLVVTIDDMSADESVVFVLNGKRLGDITDAYWVGATLTADRMTRPLDEVEAGTPRIRLNDTRVTITPRLIETGATPDPTPQPTPEPKPPTDPKPATDPTPDPVTNPEPDTQPTVPPVIPAEPETPEAEPDPVPAPTPAIDNNTTSPTAPTPDALPKNTPSPTATAQPADSKAVPKTGTAAGPAAWLLGLAGALGTNFVNRRRP